MTALPVLLRPQLTIKADDPLFGTARPLTSGSLDQGIQEFAEDQPRELYSCAVRAVSESGAARGAPSMRGMTSNQSTTYPRRVLFAEHPPSSLPPERGQEFKRPGKELDPLGDSGVKRFADIMSQKLHSLELELTRPPDLAEEIDLTRLDDVTFVSKAELRAANRNKLLREKLEKQC